MLTRCTEILDSDGANSMLNWAMYMYLFSQSGRFNSDTAGLTKVHEKEINTGSEQKAILAALTSASKGMTILSHLCSKAS